MKKKISILALLVAIATTVMAQTFVSPVTGRYYKLKGDNGTYPWLTNQLNSGNSIVVSANEDDAAVFEKTANGLRDVATGKYLGMNGPISLVDNEATVTIGEKTKDTNDGAKYSVRVVSHYLCNNKSDGITHESTSWNTGYNPFWGFIEVAVTVDPKPNAIAHVEANAANLGAGIGYYSYVVDGVKTVDPAAVKDAINAAETSEAVSAIVDSYAANLPEFGKAYKMAFKTKAGALHHIVANDATMALSVDDDEANASVFYCMQSSSADYPYIFVSAEGGFLTFKALSDAYISRVTDFKIGLMTDVTSNVNSTVDVRRGTVYITTNKRPGETADTDGCFVFKNQNNTYDGADVPFHNDNFTSAIVMTEVEVTGSKTIYNVTVNGDANAYVAYDNGKVVRRAFNEGFFVTNGATITKAQLKAGFVGNAVKSATIIMEGNEIALSDVVIFPTPEKIDLYNTSNGSLGVPPYRIPGITVDPETGRVITTAARLVCGTDPGYGQVDVVCRYSDDNGENWSEMKDVAVGTGITSPTENYFDTAFGDPAVVADRTSNEVLIIVVAGCTKYQTASRAIPNMIGTIHSLDNGNSWGTPVDVTEDIYSLFDAENGGNYMDAAFVGGGKIFQSRIVKVGDYYRLYAAMCARPNGNRVIYSDDFGRTWHALGGASALPAPGGDEPKCEEMPDGRVILSSRVGAGRIYNIYTYSNTATAEGSWGTAVTSTFEGSGKVHNGQSTNGEILIVPVVRNSDQKDMYLTLQSLPAGSGRSHVGIFYKELTDLTDINTVENFAIDWNGYFEVTSQTSAYSSMDLQNDDRIGFIYEENYTKHGSVSNPHSIPFPDANNLGTHNYDGYDNIYVAYPLEIITNGDYSIKREVSRSAYLRDYFTALAADADAEVKADVATFLSKLSDEPTITEVDRINRVLTAEESGEEWHYIRFKEGRSGSNIAQNSWGYLTDGLRTTATQTNSNEQLWKKVPVGDGTFHIVSKNGNYLVPAGTLSTSTTQPEKSWTIDASATEGLDVIFNASVPCQVHALKTGALTNWGYNSLGDGTGARKNDSGCNFEFVSVAPLTISGAGYATLYLDYAVDIPAGVEVYYASSIDGDRLMMTQVTEVIPANTGVIVKAPAGTYDFFKSATTLGAIENNLLVGTAKDKYIEGQGNTTYYVLAKVDGVVGMYKAKLTDGFFLNNANKAYLKRNTGGLGMYDDYTNTDEEGGQLSNRLRFDFSGSTDIEQTTVSGQQTTVIYDLLGRRVENPTKGVYIVGGRKVVIK